jgi:uncharacterized protein (DUF433 family)
MTLAEIGNEFGLTRERVRQILRKHGVESLGRRDAEVRPRPLTKEQKAIAKDYEAGVPPHEMFEKYPGLTATRMWNILRKAGVKGKPKGFYVRRPDYEKVAKGVVADYQKGIPCADIANKYNLCGKTEIYKFLQRAGVSVRNPIGRKPDLTAAGKEDRQALRPRHATCRTDGAVQRARLLQAPDHPAAHQHAAQAARLSSIARG